MNQHPYLRAYMAGITVPTIFLLVVSAVFCVVRYVYNLPVPIERVIVFPMAVVPNVWGLWNIVFVASHARTRLAPGVHGAVLPLVLGPFGYLMARILNFPVPHEILRIAPLAALIGFSVYYLAWKYLVAFLNRVLSIA